jgi:hypothetical protein
VETITVHAVKPIIATGQFPVDGDIRQTLRHVERQMRETKRCGAQVIFHSYHNGKWVNDARSRRRTSL